MFNTFGGYAFFVQLSSKWAKTGKLLMVNEILSSPTGTLFQISRCTGVARGSIKMQIPIQKCWAEAWDSAFLGGFLEMLMPLVCGPPLAYTVGGCLLFSLLPLSGGSDSKESAHNAGAVGSIPGLGRSPGEGNGNPLQYSYLENPIDRGVWRAESMGLQRVGND